MVLAIVSTQPAGAAATATGAAATATGAATRATATAGAQAAAATTVPQVLTCLAGPIHLPLGIHEFLTHARVLTCSPTPHVREHGPHLLHRVQ